MAEEMATTTTSEAGHYAPSPKKESDEDQYECDDNDDDYEDEVNSLFGPPDQYNSASNKDVVPSGYSSSNVTIQANHGQAETSVDDDTTAECEVPHYHTKTHVEKEYNFSKKTENRGPVRSEIEQTVAAVEDFKEQMNDVSKTIPCDDWPQTPEEYLESQSEDLKDLWETFEKLIAHAHGIKIPVSMIMNITSAQTQNFVKNATDGNIGYQDAIKANYMLLHTFATVVRRYKDLTDRLGGINKAPYFKRTNPPKVGEASRFLETDVESTAESSPPRKRKDEDNTKKPTERKNPLPTPPEPTKRKMIRPDSQETKIYGAKYSERDGPKPSDSKTKRLKEPPKDDCMVM